METLDDIINNATDPRETKRALTVKMLQTGLSPQTVTNLLNVSEQYVSKWKIRYENDGVLGLRLAYRGKAPYLTPAQHLQVVEWIKTCRNQLYQGAGYRFALACKYCPRNYGIGGRIRQNSMARVYYAYIIFFAGFYGNRQFYRRDVGI